MTTEWKDITDPEELFRLKREGWEIEVFTNWQVWVSWNGTHWDSSLVFRARPRQPKMKKVKLLAFLGYSGLHYLQENLSNVRPASWIRQPHLDLEGEIPE